MGHFHRSAAGLASGQDLRFYYGASGLPRIKVVSWGIVGIGAAVAVATSFLLCMVSAISGLLSLSLGMGSEAFLAMLDDGAILCIVAAQLIAAGLAGYAMRLLRMRQWDSSAADSNFLGIVHAGLAWGIASVATSLLLCVFVSPRRDDDPRLATSSASTQALFDMSRASGEESRLSELVNALLGKTANASTWLEIKRPEATASVESDVARIFRNAMDIGVLGPNDRRYVGQLVMRNTGIDQANSERRADEAFEQYRRAIRQSESKARSVENAQRKYMIYALLWQVLSIMVGTFVAGSVMARRGQSHTF